MASTCLYTSILFTPTQNKYSFQRFFMQIGIFPDTISRRAFIFALFDRCNFERLCPKCGVQYFDVLQHALKECPKFGYLRLILKHKLKFYNAPAEVDIRNKRELFCLSIFNKRIFIKVFCEFFVNAANIR